MKFRAALPSQNGGVPRFFRSLVLLAAIAAFLLSGCGVLSGATPTPLPTVVLGSSNPTPQAAAPGSAGGGVTASGIVVPAQEVQIASAVGENVEAVNVGAGDPVTTGQVLIRLAGSQTRSEEHTSELQSRQ